MFLVSATARWCLATALASGALGAAPAHAHDHHHKTLLIVHPWVHEMTGPNAHSADVYMTIRNTGRTPDRLISAATTRSGQIQLIPIKADAFVLKPGQETRLSKGTGFVRLLGLKKGLHMHDNFPLTLVFEKAGRVEVEVHIEEASIAEPPTH